MPWLRIFNRVVFGAAIAFVGAAAITERIRNLAIGIMLAMVWNWIDRVLLGRSMGMRYSRIVALWREDVDALEHGHPRPDLKLLDVDDKPRDRRR